MKRLTCQILLAAFALLVFVPVLAANKPASPAPYAQETPAARDARMQWWREAKFGLFLHWSPVSIQGTEVRVAQRQEAAGCHRRSRRHQRQML